MKEIKYIIGTADINVKPLPIFCDEVCSFLDELSRAILENKTIKYSDLHYLGFWCRSANIKKLKSKMEMTNNKMGRGLCFHITPSNTALNFAFSYFFGLLSGNSNIVKVPSRYYEQNVILYDLISSLFYRYPNIKSMTSFIEYNRDNVDIAKKISKVANCRMIWGGDNTIKIMKSFYTHPRYIDVCFSDRYSICIIDALKIIEASDDDMNKLAIDFYNDTYFVDQNACSSPKIIFWLNDNNIARDKFWNYIVRYASNKYLLKDISCIDKLVILCENSINIFDNIKNFYKENNVLYRIELKNIKNLKFDDLLANSGFFMNML